MTFLHDAWLTTRAIAIVLRDSHRTEQIHVVEETTGRRAFRGLAERLRATEQGRRLLDERPELSSVTVDFGALRALPASTLGGAYARHLDDNGLSADTQAAPTTLVDDEEIGYLMRRYRQTHDVWHPIVGLGTAPHEEVTIHAFSLGQLRLPVSALIVALGGLKHGLLERRWRMLSDTMPAAYAKGRRAAELMAVRWESFWGDPLVEVRRRLAVDPVGERRSGGV